MAAPSFSSVCTASSQSPSGARPTTSPSRSGSQRTTLATLRSPMSSPPQTSSSVPADTSIPAVDAQSNTSKTGQKSPRSVSPLQPCPAALTSSKPCNLADLFQAMQDHFSRAPPLYAKPKSSSPHPAPQPLPSPSSSLPLQSRHDDDDRPALPPKPISSQMPPRPIAASPLPYPQVCPSYSRSLNALNRVSSRLTCTIGPRHPYPSNHVQMSVRPNIKNQYFLPRVCDQPSNSLGNRPLLPVLITAHRRPFQPRPSQFHKLRSFHPRLSLSPLMHLHRLYKISVRTCSTMKPLHHSLLQLQHRHALRIQNCSNCMPKFMTNYDQNSLHCPSSSSWKLNGCVLSRRIFLPENPPSVMRWPD